VHLYYVGNHFPAIIHARLRMGHSQLYAHLFQIGLSESSECNCGHGIEGMWHYFFLCPHHAIHRDVLHRKVSTYATFSLKTVVFSASGCN
jgi:hypothetical protein